MEDHCRICEKPIPAMRLAASPNAVTCSKKCSLARERHLDPDGIRARREWERWCAGMDMHPERALAREKMRSVIAQLQFKQQERERG